MNILQNIPFSLSPEGLLQAQRRKSRSVENPTLVAAAEQAIQIGQALAAPTAACGAFPVKDIVGDQVLFHDGQNHRLTIGPRVDLLAPAREIMAAVCTIGPALERRVHELDAGGECLLAFMLDSVGVLALSAASEKVRQMAQEHAAQLGWGVSPALSPGSLEGWPLQGQREVCALLPMDEVGVHLNDHYVLAPHKSTTMVIGLGPGYSSTHVGSLCRYCTLTPSCWRRRECE